MNPLLFCTMQMTTRLLFVVLLGLLAFAGHGAGIVPAEASHLECSDGIDNDNDGRTDFPQDPQCTGSDDDTEAPDNAPAGSLSSSSRTSASSASPATVLTITDGKESVHPGGDLTYIITLQQNTSASAIVDAVVTLYPGIALVSADNGGRVSGAQVTWDNLTLVQNQKLVLTVQVNLASSIARNSQLVALVEADGIQAVDITSVAAGAVASSSSSSSVSSSRTSSSIRSSSAPSSAGMSSSRSSSSNAVSRAVFFTKTADTQEVVPGGTVRYTLYVQNVLLATIHDAVISDRFDGSILTVSDAGGGLLVSQNELQWKLPVLAPGQVWEQSYTLLVSSAVESGRQLENVATIAGTDVSAAAFDERVAVVQTDIVPVLPPTGAAYDAIFAVLSLPAAGTLARMQRKIRAR